MYDVAQIDSEICSKTSCRLCLQFCPEPNTILYDAGRRTAFVATDRCKGCGQCIWVCDHLARRHAIKLVMIDEIPNPITTKGIVYGPGTATYASNQKGAIFFAAPGGWSETEDNHRQGVLSVGCSVQAPADSGGSLKRPPRAPRIIKKLG